MEANEAHELREHGAHEAAMRPVAFTMSVLAVLVAITTALGHRAHMAKDIPRKMHKIPMPSPDSCLISTTKTRR